MNTDSHSPSNWKHRVRTFERFGAIVLFIAGMGASGFAQTGTGTIIGRVFNPATQEYFRNAEIAVEGTHLITYSGDDGSYTLTNVPAGEASVSVTYTGYDRATSRLNVTAGQTAVRDFDLK